jgi:hypothetical protein
MNKLLSLIYFGHVDKIRLMVRSEGKRKYLIALARSLALVHIMLIFMVRGIISNLEFPYAQFPTKFNAVAADLLFPIVLYGAYKSVASRLWLSLATVLLQVSLETCVQSAKLVQ